MKHIVPFFRPYRGKMITGLLLVVISSCCELLLPTLMSGILNQGIYQADMAYIFRCCGQMLLIALAGFGATVLGQYVNACITAGFSADLRDSVFRKAESLTAEAFGSLGTGALLTRSTRDIESISWLASMLSGSVLTIPFLFFGGVILAFRTDPVLALIMLVFLPFVFWIVVRIGRKVEPLWQKADEYIDKQNVIIRERLHGIRVIRAFGREAHEQERAAEATRVMADNIITGNVKMGLIAPLAEGLMCMSIVLILGCGARRTELGLRGISGGDMFALIQYVTLVINGVLMAAFALVMIPEARVSIRRIAQVLEAKSAETGAEEVRSLGGSVEFRNVSFAFEGASEPAVKDISFRLNEGGNAAIIGGTGSGKSTLVQLLTGLHRPTEGSILLGGEDIGTLSPQVLRENLSVSLQKPAVYSGTVRSNVAMGRPDASEEEIREALELAQLADFVRSQADGLDMKLEPSGKNLSGGQKQRLCLARCLIRQTPVYIFDDSFSALDFMTEAKLRSALREKLGSRTRITVTQRVSSAMSCDTILVLDRGRLVGQGNHAELMERCPVYREIYLSQTGGERRGR